VSWPLEAVPEGLRIFSGIFPSTAGIDGLVRLNQMGATLADVSKDWTHLWLLAAVYAGLTVLSARIAWAGEESG
jgi:ABC-2 type transport system permease protein